MKDLSWEMTVIVVAGGLPPRKYKIRGTGAGGETFTMKLEQKVKDLPEDPAEMTTWFKCGHGTMTIEAFGKWEARL